MVFDFSVRLWELREKRKLSQIQVAKAVGVMRSTIISYENNSKRSIASTLTIMRQQLCAAR